SSLNPTVSSALDRVLEKMLAREPVGRYQSAAELIAALEETGADSLTPGLTEAPADDETPDNAQLSAGQATQFDLAEPNGPSQEPGLWYVRYRDGDGQWCSLHASTTQVVQRLRSKSLPASAEVSRSPKGTYQPLGTLGEFREALTKTAP